MRGGLNLSSPQKQIQRLARGVGMPEEEKLLRNDVNAPMAGLAKRDEVSHRVVLGRTRDAFSHAVDVVDVQVGGGLTLAARATVTLQHRLLVAAERARGLGFLSVLGAQRAAFCGRQHVSAVLLKLTRLASGLRSRAINELRGAVSALTDSGHGRILTGARANG